MLFKVQELALDSGVSVKPSRKKHCQTDSTSNNVAFFSTLLSQDDTKLVLALTILEVILDLAAQHCVDSGGADCGRLVCLLLVRLKINFAEGK